MNGWRSGNLGHESDGGASRALRDATGGCARAFPRLGGSAICALCVLVISHSAVAQPAPAVRKPLPTLDQLLGLAPADGEPGSPAPALSPDAGRQDLDQRLKEPSIDDQFEEAVGLMGRSASRLTTGNDTGLDTQRIQEDTLKKLDALISQMQKQQQQSKGSPQQSQPQGEQRDQPKPAQASRSEQRSTDSTSTDAPARRDGPLRPGLESAKAAWGALPARIREMLLQGSGEKFSSGYDKLTEDYYKKLAEQRP